MIPQHVVIVSDYACINGGGAKVAIDSARLLAGAGVHVTFFAAVGPVANELSDPSIHVVCLDQSDLNHGQSPVRGIWNVAAARALDAVLDDLPQHHTIIHLHSYAKALSPAIGRAITQSDHACVMTLHDYFLACPNGGFYDYQRQEICHRRPLGMACLTTNCDARRASHKAWRVVRQVVAQQVGRLPRQLRHVICISDLQQRMIAPHLPKRCTIHRVPNPVGKGEAPKTDARDNSAFVFVGRLSPEKGAVLFAKAAKRAGVPAVIVGDGPVKEEIAAANPEARILGWQTPDQVADILRTARCVVFPSLWPEPLGLVPIEAIRLGVPVIAGRWTAAVETVAHEESGLLVERPSAVAFAAAMTLMTDDAHPIFDRVAEVTDVFTPDHHLDGLLHVYAAALAERNGPGA